MALTKCPECRGQVSEQASACPHCGYPMANVSRRSRAVLGVAVGALLALVIAGTVLSQSGQGREGPPMIAFLVVGVAVVLLALGITLKGRSA